MTDKLDEIRERWAPAIANPATVSQHLPTGMEARADIITLLGEVDRLREKVRAIKYNVEDLSMVLDQ